MISFKALNIEGKSHREITSFLMRNCTELVLDLRVNTNPKEYFNEYNDAYDCYDILDFNEFHEGIILGRNVLEEYEKYEEYEEKKTESQIDSYFNFFVKRERESYDGSEWKIYQNSIEIINPNHIIENYYKKELDVIESIIWVIDYINSKEGDHYTVSQVSEIYSFEDHNYLKDTYMRTKLEKIEPKNNFDELIKIVDEIQNLGITILYRNCWNSFYKRANDNYDYIPDSPEAHKLIEEYNNPQEYNILASIYDRLLILKNEHENIEHYDLIQAMRKPAFITLVLDIIEQNYWENGTLYSYFEDRISDELNRVTFLLSNEDDDLFYEIREFVVNKYTKRKRGYQKRNSIPKLNFYFEDIE